MRLMQISFSLDCKLREISVSFQHTEKEMKDRWYVHDMSSMLKVINFF